MGNKKNYQHQTPALGNTRLIGLVPMARKERSRPQPALLSNLHSTLLLSSSPERSSTASSGLLPASVLRLQQIYGNRTTRRLVMRRRAQQHENEINRELVNLQQNAADTLNQPVTAAAKPLTCKSFAAQPRLVACLSGGRLRPGDTDKKGGHAIAKAQKALQKAGYIYVEPTGTYDEPTGIAVLDFKGTKLTDDQGNPYKGPIINDIGPMTVKVFDRDYCIDEPEPIPVDTCKAPTGDKIDKPEWISLLRKGDGMSPRNDPETQERVYRVQQLLPNWTDTPNCQFDEKVETAVMQYQDSAGLQATGIVDRLTAKALLPKPKPQPTGERLGPPNQLLEDYLEALRMKRHIFFLNHQDALRALQRDLLSVDTSTTDDLIGLLKGVLPVALSGGYGLLEALTLREIVSKSGEVYNDNPSKTGDTIKTSFDKFFDAAWQWFTNKVGDFLKASAATNPTSAVGKFIDAQIIGLNQAEVAATQQWVQEKQTYRMLEAGEPDPAPDRPADDSRVKRVQACLNVDDSLEASFTIWYGKGMEAWASWLAQQKLKTVQDWKDKKIPQGTKMFWVPDDTPGVLQLEIRGGPPNGAPVTVWKQSIAGFSDVTREKLQGRTIGDLRLPILVKGNVEGWYDPLGRLFHPGKAIRIGRNELEHDQYVNSGSEIPDGVDWLRARAAADKLGDPSQLGGFTADDGAETVFKKDIESLKVVKLQKGG